MKILLFDNYDSFTYNLLHILKEFGADTEVFRNDRITLDEVARFDKIILSPGPGIPQEAGILLPLIERYAAGKKHPRGLPRRAGDRPGIRRDARKPRKRLSRSADPDPGCWPAGLYLRRTGIGKQVGRYHSWVVRRDTLPDCLEVTAEDADGRIMGLRHTRYDVHGVQFHPESVLTPRGCAIIENFIRN